MKNNERNNVFCMLILIFFLLIIIYDSIFRDDNANPVTYTFILTLIGIVSIGTLTFFDRLPFHNKFENNAGYMDIIISFISILSLLSYYFIQIEDRFTLFRAAGYRYDVAQLPFYISIIGIILSVILLLYNKRSRYSFLALEMNTGSLLMATLVFGGRILYI